MIQYFIKKMKGKSRNWDQLLFRIKFDNLFCRISTFTFNTLITSRWGYFTFTLVGSFTFYLVLILFSQISQKLKLQFPRTLLHLSVVGCLSSSGVKSVIKTFTHSFSFSLLDSLRHSEATPTLPVCYHTDISLFSSSLRRRPHSQNISVLFLNLSHMRKVSVIKSVWFRC